MKALLILAAVLVVMWLWEHLSTVIIMLTLASLLAFILDPFVTHLAERMPRGAAIAITYLGLIVIIGVAAVSVVPTIIRQVHNLQENLPALRAQMQESTDAWKGQYDQLPDQMKEQLTNLVNTLQETGSKMLHTFFEAALGFFSWMAKGMIMLVLSIYLLLDKRQLRDGLLDLVPVAARAETLSVVGEVLSVIRAYLRGQLFVIGFVAVAVTGWLVIWGMPYALTIGTMAGILEVIPYFGSVVGAVPAVLWALVTQGWAWAGIMIGFFVVVNQVEGHIVIPYVMGRTLEMRPLTVLLSLLVGAELGGIVGLIVAVPVCRILQVFFEHGRAMYREARERDAEALGSGEYGVGGDFSDLGSEPATAADDNALGMAGFTGRLDESAAPPPAVEPEVVEAATPEEEPPPPPDNGATAETQEAVLARPPSAVPKPPGRRKKR